LAETDTYSQRIYELPIATTVHSMPLTQANEALRMLRQGELTVAAVLVP
jgi:D-arabinose 1-dehydrogenase-like Zn-dependent alcohol dehydrogenase